MEDLHVSLPPEGNEDLNPDARVREELEEDTVLQIIQHLGYLPDDTSRQDFLEKLSHEVGSDMLYDRLMDPSIVDTSKKQDPLTHELLRDLESQYLTALALHLGQLPSNAARKRYIKKLRDETGRGDIYNDVQRDIDSHS